MIETLPSEGFMPLSRVREFMESAGVYEILCLKNGRVYIGQSKAVAWRASSHLQDLTANRHSNRALQSDWNTIADPSVFVFRLVTSIDPRDTQDLMSEEKREIDRRIKHGIVLYNTTKIVRVIDEDKIISPETHPAPAYKSLTNKPYREHNKESVVNSATCSDCGTIGYVGHHLFFFDRELRCERCIDKRSIQIEREIIRNRKKLKRESSGPMRVTSRAKMRWQLGFGSLRNNLIMAMAKYADKYAQYPTEAHFSIGCNLPEIQDVEVRHNDHTPMGYIDFPIPNR